MEPDRIKTSFKSKGVTLVEIMFSFLILVIAVLAAAGMINYGHKGTKKDFRNVRAIHLLETSMNQILKLPFKTISDSFGGSSSTFNTTSTALPGVELGTDGSDQNQIAISAIFQRQTVTFGYRPIDISNVNYVPTATETWSFLSETTSGAVFNNKLIRVETKATWTEEKSTTRSLNLVSFVVDLEN